MWLWRVLATLLLLLLLAAATCYRYCYLSASLHLCATYLPVAVLSCNPIAHRSVLVFAPPSIPPPSIPGFSRHLESALALLGNPTQRFGVLSLAKRPKAKSCRDEDNAEVKVVSQKSLSLFPSLIPMTRCVFRTPPLALSYSLSPPQLPNPQRRFQFLVAPEPNANLPAPPFVITASLPKSRS